MNIALPAFVIILGLLPGIVFFHSYFSGRFSRQAAGVSGVSEVALYLSFAVPIDALGIAVARLVGAKPHFGLIASLLTGEQAAARELAATLEVTWAATSIAYVVTLLGSGLLGNVVRRSVWALRLDVRLPLLKMKHEWYYLLQGRRSSLPRTVLSYADVLIEHPDGSQLFQGAVSSFEVSSDGGIRQLVLRDAHRGKGRSDQFRWTPIPGDVFIIMGSSIRSINMRYVTIKSKPEGGAGRRFRRIFHDLYRSFVFQEP